MPHTLKRAWWSGKVVSPTPERPRTCRRQMILPRTLTECQLLKIYLSIDLVADLIHPPISEATIMPNARRGRGFHFSCSMSRSLGPGFGFWFGFGCGVGLALTCVMTTAPDDDEWGLIVAYPNPAPAATSNLLVLGAGFQHSGYVLANINLLIALSMVFKYLDNDSFFHVKITK